MTSPSPCRERVVACTTLQTAVSFVTVTTLWLAAHGPAGWPPPHCREGFRHGSTSGSRACLPGHRPTPGRVPHREHSTFALLGAPLPACSFPPRLSLRGRPVGSEISSEFLPAQPGILCRVTRRTVHPFLDHRRPPFSSSVTCPLGMTRWSLFM